MTACYRAPLTRPLHHAGFLECRPGPPVGEPPQAGVGAAVPSLPTAGSQPDAPATSATSAKSHTSTSVSYSPESPQSPDLAGYSPAENPPTLRRSPIE